MSLEEEGRGIRVRKRRCDAGNRSEHTTPAEWLEEGPGSQRQQVAPGAGKEVLPESLWEECSPAEPLQTSCLWNSKVITLCSQEPPRSQSCVTAALCCPGVVLVEA